MGGRGTGHPAFTLLEVMVAVLILAVSLASLFSAQVQTVGATQFIKHVAVASQLARCRMSEIEIEILREGFEVAEFEDWEEGPCCELRDDEVDLVGDDPFECRWKFENVTLPSITDTQTEVGDAAMEGDMNAQAGMMGMGLLGPMLPMLQNLLEGAIRRVTVQVFWQEGPHERTIEVVQYLTNANQGQLGGMLRQNQAQDMQEEIEGDAQSPVGTESSRTSPRGPSSSRGGSSPSRMPFGGM